MCRADGMVFDDGTVMRAGRGPLPRDHHHRQRRRRAGLDGGVAADRMARSCGCTARRSPSSGPPIALVGPALARRRSARSRRTSTCRNDGFPFMTWRDADGGRACPARVCRISFSGELAYEINVAGLGRPRRLGGGDRRRRAATGSRRTAPRRCTCCAPRRATRSSARTPTAPSPRRISAWTGWCRRRRPTSSASAPSPAPRTSRPDRKQLVGLLPVDPTSVLPEGAQLVESERLVDAAGADARPRHLELPQRRARPDVRARARQGGRERVGRDAARCRWAAARSRSR